MDTQTQAQLYLADQRGCTQTDVFRSFHLFNFGSYTAESREPVGSLWALNDNSLKAGHDVTRSVDEQTDVIILPIVGGLEYKSSVGSGFLNVGQVQFFSLTKGMTYEISNPYETELINYLEIWLTNSGNAGSPMNSQTQFDLQTTNTLLPLFSTPTRAEHNQPNKGFIGRYAGRAEDVYQVTNPENGVVVYILSGAFEVQNRLLHQGDGLALTTVLARDVTFEALSNDAVLLLLESSG